MTLRSSISPIYWMAIFQFLPGPPLAQLRFNFHQNSSLPDTLGGSFFGQKRILKLHRSWEGGRKLIIMQMKFRLVERRKFCEVLCKVHLLAAGAQAFYQTYQTVAAQRTKTIFPSGNGSNAVFTLLLLATSRPRPPSPRLERESE